MNELTRARRVGFASVACAVLLRLFAAGLPMAIYRMLPQQVHMQKETGREVRSSSSYRFRFLPESAPPILPEAEVLPQFTAEDFDAIGITNPIHASADFESLLTQPLSWKLDTGEPAVLIVHTHATESYKKHSEDYAETVPYRTLDEGYNMLSIGSRVAELLEAGGISTLHDRTLHDYPDYNSAYSHSRKAIRAYLSEHPTIRLVLDIHRDALEDSKGRQLAVSADIGGEPTAQLMLVMGTGSAGATNEYWLDNLSLGMKLTAMLERSAPGITRPIVLRSQRFNQDLQAGILLVEVGAAGNSHAEALRAADRLAAAILALAHGTT